MLPAFKLWEVNIHKNILFFVSDYRCVYGQFQIEKTELSGFAPDIYDGSKLQLKFFQLFTFT